MEIILSLLKIVLAVLMVGGALLSLAGIGIFVVGVYNGIVKKNWTLLRKGVEFFGKGFLVTIITVILHTIFTALHLY